RQHCRGRDAASHHGEFHPGDGDGTDQAPLERGKRPSGWHLHDAYYIYDLGHVLNCDWSFSRQMTNYAVCMDFAFLTLQFGSLPFLALRRLSPSSYLFHSLLYLPPLQPRRSEEHTSELQSREK